ncbi:MAG: aromatic ring-hydroxylating dioxygenase subunit alpha [Pseudomonadota bacterium]|nr:aromatic ring-hydroxylating dioxygenase subunit alpha [Pseudomonadota bacterium]
MRETAGRTAESWYAAGTSAELTQAMAKRAPIGRTVLGERLVLFRDAGGRAVALTDRCLHRNAPLSAGACFDGKLGCPYHGWTYDGTGRLVGIPAQPADAPVPALSVPSWPTVERHGLVWVWMGRHPPDASKPGGEPFPMPYWDTPGWRAYYMVTPFDNGVTQLVENFMDVPHTVFVHKGWFRSEARRPVRMTVERTDASVLVTYHQPDDEIGFTGRLLNPTGEPMTHTDRFYMPNTTRVDYHFGKRGFVITSTCTPESPASTRVYTLISYNLGSRVASRLMQPALERYTRRVIEQDVVIMALQGDNLRAHGQEAFHHGEADLHHQWIELLRDRAHADQDPPEPAVRDASFWI